MMINFLLFALRRYARFGSYVAVFLAGVGFSIQGSYFWVPLAISVVLGSAPMSADPRSRKCPRQNLSGRMLLLPLSPLLSARI